MVRLNHPNLLGAQYSFSEAVWRIYIGSIFKICHYSHCSPSLFSNVEDESLIWNSLSGLKHWNTFNIHFFVNTDTHVRMRRNETTEKKIYHRLNSCIDPPKGFGLSWQGHGFLRSRLFIIYCNLSHGKGAALCKTRFEREIPSAITFIWNVLNHLSH